MRSCHAQLACGTPHAISIDTNRHFDFYNRIEHPLNVSENHLNGRVMFYHVTLQPPGGH